MKTDKVNNETLLVKGSVQTKRQKNHGQHGRMNYWTMTRAMANNTTQEVTVAMWKIDIKIFDCGNAISSAAKKTRSVKMLYFNKRNCLSNLQNSRKCNDIAENAPSPCFIRRYFFVVVIFRIQVKIKTFYCRPWLKLVATEHISNGIYNYGHEQYQFNLN